MSISNVLQSSFADRDHQGFQGASMPRLNARQEYAVLLGAMAAFLAGGTGVVLYALAALGQ